MTKTTCVQEWSLNQECKECRKTVNLRGSNGTIMEWHSLSGYNCFPKSYSSCKNSKTNNSYKTRKTKARAALLTACLVDGDRWRSEPERFHLRRQQLIRTPPGERDEIHFSSRLFKLGRLMFKTFLLGRREFKFVVSLCSSTSSMHCFLSFFSSVTLNSLITHNEKKSKLLIQFCLLYTNRKICRCFYLERFIWYKYGL